MLFALQCCVFRMRIVSVAEMTNDDAMIVVPRSRFAIMYVHAMCTHIFLGHIVICTYRKTSYGSDLLASSELVHPATAHTLHTFYGTLVHDDARNI